MTEEVKKETPKTKIARLAAVGCAYLCGSHFYYDHGVP